MAIRMASGSLHESRTGGQWKLAGILALALATPAFSQFLVVRTDAAGIIAYESYEEISINGQSRVRTPSGGIATVDATTYKTMGRVNLAEAGVLRRGAGVLVQLSESGGRTLLLPDQLKIQGPTSAVEIWKTTAIVVKKFKKDKEGPALGLHQVLAIVPCASPSAGAAAFVTAPANFDSVEEHGAALIAAAEAFRRTSDGAAILAYFTRNLQDGWDKLEAAGAYAGFLRMVQYAQFAQKAFPEDQRLMKLAGAVLEKRAWMDETTRMLESLANNRNWDTFLDRYPGFEKYQDSFPTLSEARRKAYEESARFHASLGRNLIAQSKYAEALSQLRAAQSRDPENKALEALAEGARIDAAHAMAGERAPLRRGLPEGSANAVLFDRHLADAALSINEKRFKEAFAALTAAEELDKNSSRLLLMRARYFQGTNQFAKALELLDSYDESVTGKDELKAGEDLRIPVAHAMQRLHSDNTAKLDQLIAAGRYWDAQSLAAQSLEADPKYVDFLYRAGIIAAVLRNKDAASLLQRYIQGSDSLHGDLQTRTRATRLLAFLQASPPTAPKTSGKPNWFSGNPMPQGAFYCPLSLAFQPHIESVRAHKMTVKFEWGPGDQLQRIVTAFDDVKAKQDYLAHQTRRAGGAAEPSSVFFGYRPGIALVFRVAEGLAMPPAQSGLPALRRDAKGWTFSGEGSATEGGWNYPVLTNHPLVDAGAVALLDGEIATSIAGNSYFNPFVWDGLHIFRLQYDKLGRVEAAREIGTANLVRFEWRNHQLLSLTAYDVTDPKPEHPTYKRSMAYDGDLLISENVEFGNKSYKIIYVYQGNALASAAFTDNGAHDGAERKIKFVLP